MPRELVLPAALMTLALTSYTWGVWAERLRHDLVPLHVVAFWLGLVFDAAGTELMYELTAEGLQSGVVHTVFGVSAFTLMLLHALWATVVLARGSAESRRGFHRYSLLVWLVWLVPYLGGMIAGVTRGFGI